MQSVATGVEDIGSNINNQLNIKANDFEWFSLVLDELTDVTKTAQVFICKVSGDFEVTEEIHLMNSVHGIATDRNIY